MDGGCPRGIKSPDFLRRSGIDWPGTAQNSPEVMKMTSKESLYVEDALGHEQYFQTKCREAANQLQDAELRNYVEQLEKKHKQIFQSFYNLL